MINHISNVVNNISEARLQKEEKPMLDPLATHLVEQIFIKMALICRGFDSFYADRTRLNAEKTQWILAFSKLGIKSKSQIDLALTKLESYKFPNPPQLGEFLEWRKLSIKALDFPDVQQAFYIANRINMQFSDYKHEDERLSIVLKYIIGQIGSTRFREMKIDKALKLFESYYHVALNQYINGELKTIHGMLEDNSEETKELSKQESIVKDEYKNISCENAFEIIRKLLT